MCKEKVHLRIRDRIGSLRYVAEWYRGLKVQVRASLWALICGVLQRGVSFLVMPIFTRLMSTGEYGEFVTFQSWLEIIGIFLTLRLYYGAFLQGLVRYDDDKEHYTSSLIGLMTTFEVLGLLIYLPLSGFWNSLSSLTTVQTISLFAITWATGLFEFWCARQRVVYHYRALTVLTITFAIAQPLCGVISVLSFPGSRVSARVISMALVQIALFGWIFVKYMREGGGFYDRKHWSRALRFNLPLVPHYLSGSMLSTSDRIMIRSMVSTTAAGIYGLAYSISFLMTIVNQAILNTLNPWIYQQIKMRRYDILARVSYLALGGVAAANLAVVILAPEAIALFAPEEYSQGVYLVPPLAATVVTIFMYNLFSDFEFYYERTEFVMWASVVGAAANIALNSLLIPIFGYQVAAWTTLIGYIIYVGMHYYFMRRVQAAEMDNIKVYNPTVLLAILLTFGSLAFLMMMFYPYPVIRYLSFSFMLIIVISKRKYLISIVKTIR